MNPECPNCGSTSNRRVARKKDLKHRVMYFLGKFPWECLNCQKSFFSDRRYTRSKRHSQGEVYLGPSKTHRVKPGSEEQRS